MKLILKAEQLSMFGLPPKHVPDGRDRGDVKRPGIRGGRYYIDKVGKVQYGEQPTSHGGRYWKVTTVRATGDAAHPLSLSGMNTGLTKPDAFSWMIHPVTMAGDMPTDTYGYDWSNAKFEPGTLALLRQHKADLAYPELRDVPGWDSSPRSSPRDPILAAEAAARGEERIGRAEAAHAHAGDTKTFGVQLTGSYDGVDRVAGGAFSLGKNATSTKKKFQNDAKKYLAAVNAELGLKGTVKANSGGDGIAGEVELVAETPDRKVVLVTVTGDAMNDAGASPSGARIMWRVGHQRFATDGTNQWVKWDEPAGYLAGKIQHALATKLGESKEPKPGEWYDPKDKPPQSPDTRPGPYYVTAIDGDRTYLMSGPFERHADALAAVDWAKELSYKLDAKGRAHFMSWGTTRLTDPRVARIGRLEQLGHKPPSQVAAAAKPEPPAELPPATQLPFDAPSGEVQRRLGEEALLARDAAWALLMQNPEVPLRLSYKREWPRVVPLRGDDQAPNGWTVDRIRIPANLNREQLGAWIRTRMATMPLLAPSAEPKLTTRDVDRARTVPSDAKRDRDLLAKLVEGRGTVRRRPGGGYEIRVSPGIANETQIRASLDSLGWNYQEHARGGAVVIVVR